MTNNVKKKSMKKFSELINYYIYKLKMASRTHSTKIE